MDSEKNSELADAMSSLVSALTSGGELNRISKVLSSNVDFDLGFLAVPGSVHTGPPSEVLWDHMEYLAIGRRRIGNSEPVDLLLWAWMSFLYTLNHDYIDTRHRFPNFIGTMVICSHEIQRQEIALCLSAFLRQLELARIPLERNEFEPTLFMLGQLTLSLSLVSQYSESIPKAAHAACPPGITMRQSGWVFDFVDECWVGDTDVWKKLVGSLASKVCSPTGISTLAARLGG